MWQCYESVMCVNQCSNEVVTTNATINSFMELKKLKLSSTKCSRIHIGKQALECPEIKVDEDVMKNSQKEKHLGDVMQNLMPQLKQELAKAGHMYQKLEPY